MVDRASVVIESPRGEIRFEDGADHFENGVLRLLGLSREAFSHWLAMAEAEPGSDLLERLGRAFRRLSPLARADTLHSAEVEPGPGNAPGALWHSSIAENRDYGVARSRDGKLGWLVKLNGDVWSREREPPRYEEAYFEGDRANAGGYGNYQAQSDWRLEKAARQVRELGDATGLRAGRVLDVGSGYGFFRKALGDAGFAHDGLEVSEHARRTAEQLFGFDTFSGSLAEHAREWTGRYDVLTLWDVIEHVAEPSELLSEAFACLVPGGILAVKTPNLRCPEARVFGPHYHSLKREHLVYFTPESLVAFAERAGFQVASVSSVSHLLTGFIGAARAAEIASRNEGADLMCYLRRPR
jgi:2-polyprenyl-3-methyl-5-hydroxy-6-metoxy-1,4-benzoquinol methylase